MRKTHCRTKIMVRKPKIMENEKHTLVGHGRQGETVKKRGKGEVHNVGPRVWR